MAEENDESQEKTEEPSAKRQKEAREKGQVARSKDFNATVILLSTSVGFMVIGQYMSSQLAQMMQYAFSWDYQILRTTSTTLQHVIILFRLGLSAVWPILALIVVVSIAAPVLLGGFVFSQQAFAPQFSRLSPLKGIKRIFSLKGFMEMVKALLKFILIAATAILVLKWNFPYFMGLANATVEHAIFGGGQTVLISFLLIASSLIIISLIDVPFQLYEHNKSMKMSKQELKDEYKESEGKPEVKGFIRRAQQEIAKRRMMSDVTKADVVLTNPTHYAVAIKYNQKGKRAPVVVAKGQDIVAFQLSRVAKEHEVPILCIPPLARAVFYSTKLNAEIPKGLYVAVAQVLAYIFQLRDKTRYDAKPDILQDVPIPPDLAKEAKEDDR